MLLLGRLFSGALFAGALFGLAEVVLSKDGDSWVVKTAYVIGDDGVEPSMFIVNQNHSLLILMLGVAASGALE